MLRRGIFVTVLGAFLIIGFGAGVAYAWPTRATPLQDTIKASSAVLPRAAVLPVAAKKTQRITVVLPKTAPLADGTLALPATSSARLPVAATSKTPAVCKARKSNLLLLDIGTCTIDFVQAGNRTYAAAKVTRSISVQGENELSVVSIESAMLTDGSVSDPVSSSSGLPPQGVDLTPSVCASSSDTIRLLTTGQCTVEWQQPGDAYHPPATPVRSDFKVLTANAITFEPPARLTVASQPFELVGTATSGKEIKFAASPAEVCVVTGQALRLIAPGTCTVTATQDAIDWYVAATPVTRSITVSWARSTVDQPDLIAGYQLHFVYVVPSDGVDHGYDTDGTIKAWIDEGQAYTKGQIGVTFPVDSTSAGYDIQFLKSQYTSAQLSAWTSSKSCDDAAGIISRELGVSCFSRTGTPYNSMKHYVYLVDVPRFGGSYCGYAGKPGNVSVVAAQSGSSCARQGFGFTTFVVLVWLHEVIHGLGVDHAPAGSCDLMEAGGFSCASFTMDPKRRYYVGSATLGIDILTLGFWIRT